MGDYSLVCNVSKITIAPGNPCVLIPLANSAKYSDSRYHVALMPIFGTYSGYGDMEDIEQTANTAYLSTKYGDIEQFVTDIMRAKYDDVVYPEYKHWMLVDRTVWDNLSTNVYDTYRLGNHELGNPEFLKHVGFEYVGFTNADRYNYEWAHNGVSVWSNNRSLVSANDDIFTFKELCQYANLHEDVHWLNDVITAQAWHVFLKDAEFLDRLFSPIFGAKEVFRLLKQKEFDLEVYLANPLSTSFYIESNTIELFSKPAIYYFMHFNSFANMFSKLHTFRANCLTFSTDFESQADLVTHTPQYGEFTAHAKILQMFADTCSYYARDQGDDYDED